MTLETLITAYQQLSPIEKTRFLELIEPEVPDWADKATRSLTEQEWRAMEAELAAVRNGTAEAMPLQDAIAALSR